MSDERTMVARAADAAAIGLSAAADHGAVVAGIVLADTLLRRQRSLRTAAGLLAIVGIPVVAVNTGLKRLVGRQRPDPAAATGSTVLRRPSSSSFPSGHTLAVTTAAIALPSTPAGQVAALAGAGAVGWSRLRVGAHHPSDVLGGMAIGGLLGLGLRGLAQGLARRSPVR
jgi:undecaprenyl-diphosphatase